MNAKPQITIVDTIDSLRELRKRLVSEEIVAIDTEFHAENRYFPKLMLMQIACIDGDVWLIDPLKVNPEPLAVAMKKLTIISHSGREDVRLLYHSLGLIPEKYFDTQIAAGILGCHYPIGLDRLAKTFLEQTMSKGETLADWSRRPLRDTQIQYAAQDARILIPLYQTQLAQLKKTNKEKWAWAASEELLRESLRPKYAGLDWQEWNIASSLDLPTQRVLTKLLAWREDNAEHRNKPAKYVLPRSSALYLAKKRPTSLKHIKNRRINRKFLSKYGPELIQIIQVAIKSTETFTLPTAQETLLASTLQCWAKLLSEEIGIHSSLLMPNGTAKDIAVNSPKNGLFGWRNHVFGKRLELFLQGKEFIIVENGQPRLQSK
jgi:ribonuclease D